MEDSGAGDPDSSGSRAVVSPDKDLEEGSEEPNTQASPIRRAIRRSERDRKLSTKTKPFTLSLAKDTNSPSKPEDAVSFDKDIKRGSDYQLDTPTSPVRRDKRRSARVERSRNPSFETKLVTFSVDRDTKEASWVESTSGSPKTLTGNPPGAATKRRISGSSLQTDSPDKVLRSQAYQTDATPRNLGGPSHLENIAHVLACYATSIASWSLHVLIGALRLLKIPISCILAIWLLFVIGLAMRTLFFKSLYATLSPVCYIPGVSLLNLPICPTNSSPVEFDELMRVSSRLEVLLEDVGAREDPPAQIKRGQVAIRDLGILVELSTLESKDILLAQIGDFIKTSGLASFRLQRFQYRIGTAIDFILLVADSTVKHLTATKHNNLGLLGDMIISYLARVGYVERVAQRHFFSLTELVKEQVKELIDEAQVVFDVLLKLEHSLGSIQATTAAQVKTTQISKDELLSDLWKHLRAQVGFRTLLDKQAESDLKDIKHVGSYHQVARNHVTETLIQLQEIHTGLVNLEERASMPQNWQGKAHVSMEMHIDLIRSGSQTLMEARLFTKRLEARRNKNIGNDSGGNGSGGKNPDVKNPDIKHVTVTSKSPNRKKKN